MFNKQTIIHYIIGFSVICAASYFANKVKDSLSNQGDEYELIKKYLLNDSPLYGYNKPKMWVHTKYEINSRKWKSFYSRNSVDLNQPYIHLTIKTLINHCGDDFNICLIDDDTFSKLIPNWSIDLKTVAEPMRSHIREVGLMELVYYYGGMVVPNSFLCTRNLKELYESGVYENKMFVCERLNRHLNNSQRQANMLFTPDSYFCGAVKNCEIVKEYVKYLKAKNNSPHFSNESDFTGESNEWLISKIDAGQIQLVNGEMIGIKKRNRKPVLVDDLMEENYLDLPTNVYGIYIPEDELLRRNKYNWFVTMESEQIFESSIILAKYLKASIVDSTNEYTKSTAIKTVVSI